MTRNLLMAMLANGVSVLAVSSVWAQETDLGAEVPFDLGEIMLYGDRSAETLADSNVSVGVVDAEALVSPTVSDFRDAFAHVANARASHQTEAGFILRGVNSEGQTPGAFGTPLASYYIDGVQQTVESTRRGARGMFDMQQLEIYRGPQSTLSGRAALGGAVYLRSVEPEFDNTGKVQLTFGSNNRRRIGAMANLSHSDQFAFRISGEWSENDTDLNYPTYTQYPLYDEFAKDDYRQVNARMLWRPSGDDTTRVLATFAHSVNSPYYRDIAGPGRNTLIPGAAPSFGDDRGDLFGGLTILNQFGIIQPFNQDLRETTTNSFGLEVTHEFSEALTLTAQTGWNNSVTDRKSITVGATFDPTVDPWNGFNNVTDFDDTIYSQEVRLNYETESLRWVAGVYAAQEKNDGTGTLDLSAGTIPLPADLDMGGGFVIPAGTPLSAGVSSFDNQGKTSNYAAFGEFQYEFAPRFSVIAGGRLDYFKRESEISTVTSGRGPIVSMVLGPNGAPAPTHSSFTDTVFIPKIGLEYELGDTQSLAFVYQQGYRPGGAGLRLSDMTTFEFDAEKAHNYELTYRGSLMDDRLNVAASAFYNKWSNQQVEIWQTSSSNSSYIVNAGKSTSYGAELELSYAAADALDVYASVGLLHSKFDHFTVGSTDYSGRAFPNSSKTNASLGYRYGDDTGWFSTGRITYTGASTGALNTSVSGYGLDAYTVVDLEIGYTWESGAKLSAYADNLFDERYFVNANGAGSQATLGESREFGVQLEYTF